MLLLVFSPLIIIGCGFSGFSFKRTNRLGQYRQTFYELSFNSDKGAVGTILKKLHLTRLPVLFNIARGDMSFVGPLPKSLGDLKLSERDLIQRCLVRPGLISLWWIRLCANIDYETEFAVDLQYITSRGFWSDLGICLRAVPAILYGARTPVTRDKLNLLGIPIDNLTMAAAIETILDWLNDEGSRQICFVNADCVNIAYNNNAYLKVLNNADLCLADGIGIKLAGKFMAQEIAQNLCGTDMFPRLCQRISGTDVTLFLLGAKPQATEGVTNWIHAHYPGITVCGYQHGYFQPEEEPAIIQRIKDSGAQLLLVAFGVPKQDIWIHEHLKETRVRVAIGVGGLFDFYSGLIPRAPRWIREIGMEWLYRLLQEPSRMWRRYVVGNPLFMWRVLRERFRKRY